MNPADVWVVVPAFNEAGVIGEVVGALTRAGYSVVVVDDGSTDDSSGALRGHAVHVCRHVVNLGMGAALQTGLRYALQRNAAVLVTFDADGQHDPDDIQRLLEALERERCDVALGTRFAAGATAAGMPASRRLLLKLAVYYTRATTGLKVTDTHNGLRAFRADAAARLAITQNRMAHASQILTQIARTRMRYVEVPVNIRYTAYSRAKGQRTSNSLNILWESLLEVFKR